MHFVHKNVLLSYHCQICSLHQTFSTHKFLHQNDRYANPWPYVHFVFYRFDSDSVFSDPFQAFLITNCFFALSNLNPVKKAPSHSCFMSGQSTTSRPLSHTPLLMQFPPPSHNWVNTKSLKSSPGRYPPPNLLARQTAGGVGRFSWALDLGQLTC